MLIPPRQPLVLPSLVVAASFWLTESLLHALLEGTGFLTHLLPADVNELWMRSVVVVLILACGISGNRREGAEAEEILDRTRDAYLKVDAHWRLTYLNASAENLFGVRRRRALGKVAWDVYPELASTFYRPFQKSLSEGLETTVEGFYSARDKHLEAHSFPDKDGMGFFFRDITQQKQREKALTENFKRLQTILDNASDGIITISSNGLVETFNNAAQQIFGYTANEVVGSNVSVLMPAVDAEHHDDHISNYLRTRVPKILDTGPREVTGRRKNGQILPLELAVSEMRLEEHTFFIGILRDITERKRSQETLEYMSNFDALTGLPNRSLLRDRLKHAIQKASREERLLAVMFLDLDRFKNINDTLGHAMGDQLLRTVARRLEECVRKDDTVARISGDEFVIVLEGIKHVDHAAMVAKKILSILSSPVKLDSTEMIISASIGITIYPFDDDNIDDLLKDADTAMYRAKDQGRNNYQYFTADMTVRALEHLNLEQDLRRALEREEFELLYQPQVDVESGKAIGVEALLRWNHPERGAVSPIEFIPLLEDTGLIVPVGAWVLRNACEQVRLWRQSGLPDLRVAVNLSARQFRQKDIASTIGDLLEQTGLDASALELEITEHILMENVGSTVATLEALKQMGVGLCIDDFGTGYSSLSYLKRFPLQALKIDQSFVRDVTHDADNAAIVQAILALAHSLRLSVVAEGVETESQVDFLKRLGCHHVQGFLFCPPCRPEELLNRMLSGEWQQGG